MPSEIVETTFTRRVRLFEKKCAHPKCGKDFKGPENRQYCSQSCSRRAAYERVRQRAGQTAPKRRFTPIKDWNTSDG